MKKIFSNKRNIIQIIAYLIIGLPMCYAIWYSVPASDDFAFGVSNISDNPFANAWGYVVYNYFYHSGRWLTFFIQKLINPLNLGVHLGHGYGVYMIVLFIITSAILIYALMVIWDHLVGKEMAGLATLLSVALFYTTNYYSEIFNWYVGGTAYALPLALAFLSVALTLRYTDTHDKRYYIGLIAAGIIPATNEFLDIPLGIAYLFIAFYLDRAFLTASDKNEKTKLFIRQALPLVIFILCGMSVVLAPGNFVRQSTYEAKGSLASGIIQTIIDILVRCKELIFTHSWSLIILAGIFLIGFFAKKDKPVSLKIGIFLMITMTIATFGCLFPYVYGRAFTTSYVDVRMEYVVELLMELTLAILVFLIGQLLGQLFASLKVAYVLAALVVLGALALMVRAHSFTSIVQIDIMRHSALLQESYSLWDGVITEIEESTDDDVVIHRGSEPDWSPYFLYMGLTDGDTYAVAMDEIYSVESIMPNVYYGKRSITLYFDNK